MNPGAGYPAYSLSRGVSVFRPLEPQCFYESVDNMSTVTALATGRHDFECYTFSLRLLNNLERFEIHSIAFYNYRFAAT